MPTQSNFKLRNKSLLSQTNPEIVYDTFTVKINDLFKVIDRHPLIEFAFHVHQKLT